MIHYSHQNKNFYGRRTSYKLTPHQQHLFNNLLPSLLVDISKEINSTSSEEEFIDPNKLFSDDINDICLEIGFGGGEHLIYQALDNPDIGYIGCEPYKDGIAKLLNQIDKNNLNNIRIYDDDATTLINHIKPHSLSNIYLLYPDPWPKKRHHKRRFVNHTTIDLFSTILKVGGKFLFSSDIEDYIFWSLKHFAKHPQFEWTAQTADDWRIRPVNWPQTRYEKKAIKNSRIPTYLTFQKMY